MEKTKLGPGLVAFGCVTVSLWMVFWMALTAATTGIAVAVLWNWFVVSLLDVPRLTLLHAYGISLLTAAVMPVPQTGTGEDEEENAMLKLLGRVIIRPASLVFFGWVVKLLIGG